MMRGLIIAMSSERQYLQVLSMPLDREKDFVSRCYMRECGEASQGHSSGETTALDLPVFFSTIAARRVIVAETCGNAGGAR